MESILIANTTILDHNGVRKGSVLVEDDLISDVSLDLSPGDADIVINAEENLLIPGLVNTHTHLSMTLFRGLADDLPLDTWLNEHIWPMEAHLDGDYCYAGALLGCIEMVKSGTTAFNDMYFYMDHVARAVDEVGLRCLISHGMIDLGDDEKRRAELAESERIIKKCHGKSDGRIRVALGPHSPYTCSEELLKESASIAKRYGLPIHIHVAETENEVDNLIESHEMRPFEYLKDLGVLEASTIAAHAVWLSEEEIKIIKEKDVKISHNPASNMKLASGVSPVTRLIKEGVTVALGTDGAASNNNLDMIEEMKTASLLQKVHNMDPTALKAADVFEMATINGAKALDIDAGLIEKGKKADLVLLNTRRAHLRPWRNPLSHIVYSSSGGDVETVICNGELLLFEGELERVDEDEVLEIAEAAAEDLISSVKK